MTIAEFIASQGMTMKVERIAERPDGVEWGDVRARHFRCVIRKGRRSMTVYFSQGSAHTKEPTLADVLDCIASDCSGGEQDFNSWASEYGYNDDSRSAFQTYKTIQKQCAALKRVLNDPKAFETLLCDVERL